LNLYGHLLFKRWIQFIDTRIPRPLLKVTIEFIKFNIL